jgi:hypothetical protein
LPTKNIEVLNNNNKKRFLKDFDKLDAELKQQVEEAFPNGYSQHLESFTTPKGERIQALRFETEDTIYMIKMAVIDLTKIKAIEDLDEAPIEEAGEEAEDDDGDSSSSDDDDYDEGSSYKKKPKSYDEEEY